MSLINQMLRDLESRKTSNDAPQTLQLNIQATRPSPSKAPLLLWSLLTVIVTGGIYSAYQYSITLTKAPPVIVADNVKKDPIPVVSYEKVLVAPNAVTDPAPKIELSPFENTTAHPVSAVQPAPAVQTVPTVQPKAPAQPDQTLPAIQPPLEIVAGPPTKKVPAAPKPALTESATAKLQADALYRQAESNSDDYSAVYKLEQALNLDPRHLKARLLLAKKLHNQGQVLRTAELLDQGLALFPDNLQFINTRAQLYLQQKNPNDALKTLQRIDLINSSNEAYLSLLAATYQQLQSFANAAKVYQRLVNVNPEKAENWLGLALSLEKVGNTKLAIEAYQQALSKNTLKESISSYIKQRLTELR
ncbi:MAG TPA: tetratricopeptide repeat protein [Methylobacter sp.]|jgi:regulator of sirC expression with transglutaminase-like and TPR domain